MASALMAFVQGLDQAEKDIEKDQKKVNSVNEVDDDDLFESDNEEPATEEQTTNTKKMTLMDIAKSEQQSAPTSSPSKPESLTLLQVAKQELQHHQQNTKVTLSMLAAQVNEEDGAVQQQRAAQIQSKLAVTSAAVKAEKQQEQATQVTKGLTEAVAEDQAYQGDKFEVEEAAIAQAANALVKTIANSKNKPNGLALSVDRHVLKQRQSQHGLQSKSTSKAQTLKDKLSVFQCNQLTVTQKRLFLATLVGEPPGMEKKKYCNMAAIEELAKDKAKLHRQKYPSRKKQEYARLDDNRHCRFRPRLVTGGQSGERKSNSNNDSDDDNNSGSANQRSEDFVRRMEAAERARLEQLRRTREEKAYLARVDKKECPACGNPQSYSELTQKRKKCPNCGITYKNRIAWSTVADEFLDRMASFLQARRDWRQQQVQEQEQNDKKQHQCHRRLPKTWAEVQDEFLGRVQLDLMNRELSKEAIWKELQQECSFVPVITRKAKQLGMEDFDKRMQRDLEQRRLREQQYKYLARAITREETAAKLRNPLYNNKRTKPQPFSAAFQERLRADLDKRQERQRQQKDLPSLSRFTAWTKAS